MCGRFTQTQTAEALASAFQLTAIPDWQPRYNLAPTQAVPTLLQTPDQPGEQFKPLRWGLIPSWAKDLSIGARLINARAETVAEKPSFRAAFKRRRCLILADGFYEWYRQKGKKQPYYFHLLEHQPFAFAGLWEHWESDGNEIESCTIVTTQANDRVQPIHDRMPVILPPETYDEWLDLATGSDRLQALLNPYNAEKMQSYPVSSRVNSATNDSPECIEVI